MSTYEDTAMEEPKDPKEPNHSLIVAAMIIMGAISLVALFLFFWGPL
jgi:hypothetical protein